MKHIRHNDNYPGLNPLKNADGELLNVSFTPGNTDDRSCVSELVAPVFGKLYADKGYISEDLHETLQHQGIDLVYKVRKNMKPEPYPTLTPRC